MYRIHSLRWTPGDKGKRAFLIAATTLLCEGSLDSRNGKRVEGAACDTRGLDVRCERRELARERVKERGG
jgi:hypothetical protein